MSRTEYMKQLAYLLQDVPEQERQEILEYYEDYFAEAGQEQEAQTIEALGSPERLAAMIKDGLRRETGSIYGQYTDSGYRDERFREEGHDLRSPTEQERQWRRIHLGNLLEDKKMSTRNKILCAVVVLLFFMSIGIWQPLALVGAAGIIYLMYRSKQDNGGNGDEKNL